LYAGPEDVFPYYHEYLRPKTPGGRGFLVNRTAFEAGTRRGQAIMIGSSEQLVEKILDAHTDVTVFSPLEPKLKLLTDDLLWWTAALHTARHSQISE
jgi:hypothetical protein